MTASVMTAPLWQRLTLPEWLVRARQRRRPGVPVTAWLGAWLLMGLCWLIGERRGVLGALLLSVWVLAPVTAAMVTGLWIRRTPAERR